MNYSDLNFILFDLFTDVLSKLEQVETLDLSYNEVKDLKSDESNFTLPDNLKRLYFGNNLLTHFPTEAFANLSNVDEINLEHNAIERFNLTMLKGVRNGLILNIHGKLISTSNLLFELIIRSQSLQVIR